MPASVRAAIGKSLEDKFVFLLTKLAAGGTRAVAERHAPFVPGTFPIESSAVHAGKGAEDVTGLSD